MGTTMRWHRGGGGPIAMVTCYIHGQTSFVDGGMTLDPEFARGG
jgi:hypothetical protein